MSKSGDKNRCSRMLQRKPENSQIMSLMTVLLSFVITLDDARRLEMATRNDKTTNARRGRGAKEDRSGSCFQAEESSKGRKEKLMMLLDEIKLKVIFRITHDFSSRTN